MQHIVEYQSPLGEIVITADEIGLTGLWFTEQKSLALCPAEGYSKQETSILSAAKGWLDVYFGGQRPNFDLPLHFIGTAFQDTVWRILATIPYGQTTTYGGIAQQLTKQHGFCRMSTQAVGGAVGRNKISVIVPCHRVLGANGELTGYAGGLDRKIRLLELEGIKYRRPGNNREKLE